ncbi:thiamine phosphate synthase [Litoribacter populi]|uniref:thiamine phosphate synthase n=1 Tax=Litoribacter populi TaxID=2598460 RepID=UPI00117EF5B6|nr:thiamine phosphate synthase [Litoribacter populi]
MKIILFSSPTPLSKEADLIRSYLDCGIEYFHLKKPLLPENALLRLIELIGDEHREKIALHSHHHIARPLGIKRLHFPEILRDNTPAEDFENLLDQGFHLTTSVHSFGTLENLPNHFHYVFMGPIFPSISKKGYGAPFEASKWNQVKEVNTPLIAIGGLNKEKLPIIKDLGFSGAALLGSVWKSTYPQAMEEIRASLEFEKNV